MKNLLILLMITFSMNAIAQVKVKVDIKTDDQFECYRKTNFDDAKWERWLYPEDFHCFVAKAFEGDTVNVVLIKYAGTACADTTQIIVFGSDVILKVKPDITLDGKKRIYQYAKREN